MIVYTVQYITGIWDGILVTGIPSYFFAYTMVYT
jgi:hypothetical protein